MSTSANPTIRVFTFNQVLCMDSFDLAGSQFQRMKVKRIFLDALADNRARLKALSKKIRKAKGKPLTLTVDEQISAAVLVGTELQIDEDDQGYMRLQTMYPTAVIVRDSAIHVHEEHPIKGVQLTIIKR